MCCRNLESAVNKRQRWINHVNAICEALNVAELYYEIQNKEVAVVVNVSVTVSGFVIYHLLILL